VTGPRGRPGSTGSRGITGATGYTGPEGPLGRTGIVGVVGVAGGVGATGATGLPGPVGAVGATGPGAAAVFGNPAGMHYYHIHIYMYAAINYYREAQKLSPLCLIACIFKNYQLICVIFWH